MSILSQENVGALNAIPGKLTRTGLELPEGLAYDEWERVGVMLRAVNDSRLWWWGDWLNYGERRYGEKYTQALEESDYEAITLRTASWVARRVEMSRRRDNLSWSHHREVAALAPEVQDAWLDDAARYRWSRNTLRAMIRDDQRLFEPAADGDDHAENRKTPRERHVCGKCGEVFSAAVWHCDTCEHHWPLGRETCWNCHDQVEHTAPDTTPYVPSVRDEMPATLANHQLINTSTNNEWYTPRPFLDAAHELMGGVDLDPASNERANLIVRARRFFTVEDDGLAQPWAGRVWLNPPYGTTDGESNQARWSRRLLAEYRAGRVSEAILLVNAVTGNAWFSPLKQFPICFPDSRIRFYNADTAAGQPTHSNALIYFGPNVTGFAAIFARFGAVLATRGVWDGAR